MDCCSAVGTRGNLLSYLFFPRPHRGRGSPGSNGRGCHCPGRSQLAGVAGRGSEFWGERPVNRKWFSIGCLVDRFWLLVRCRFNNIDLDTERLGRWLLLEHAFVLEDNFSLADFRGDECGGRDATAAQFCPFRVVGNFTRQFQFLGPGRVVPAEPVVGLLSRRIRIFSPTGNLNVLPLSLSVNWSETE